LPGEFPYTRSTRPDNDWEIRQDIIIDDILSANKKALEALSRGADGIGFNLKNISLEKQEDFSRLVNGIDPEKCSLHFISGKQSGRVLTMFIEEVKQRGIDKNKVNGSVAFDPLGYLCVNGNFYQAEDSDFTMLKSSIELSRQHLPNIKIIAVTGNYFHNSGSTLVQELAFSFSMAVEYISRLIQSGISIDDILPRMQFCFAVGSAYFMEMARLRSARLLWSHIAKAFNPLTDEFCKITIHTVTSSWNKTMYDPYVNLLRTTTESMSAIIGGTDSHTVKPFNLAFKKSDDFSERVSRNQQIILKEESFLGKVVDPGSGSYYIENLTASVSEEAWKLFLSVEGKGGFLAALKAGFIQDEIRKVSIQRDTGIATRRDTVLGTNQFPNLSETASGNFTLHCHTEKNKGTILVTPLNQYRGSAAFEELRLRTEKSKKGKPKVFLFTIGNLAMRKARAGFATNFFGCAGFQIIDNPGFSNVQEGVNDCIKQKCEICVICGSDDEYATLVPEIFEAVKDHSIVVLAGFPKALVDNFKAQGLKHYIYMGCNVLEILQGFQKELGL
jgi:methylmalonyl-CoA mutase